MSHVNSILALRQRELAESTREFRTRGGKVIRCQQCLLSRVNCICVAKPQVSSRSAFCFVMYKGESYKPSNTGRLIADVVADNHAFLWHRTEPDDELLALLANDRYAPILVFPHEYAEPQRCINSPDELPALAEGKTPLFVMFDGTWREAKKMFRSGYLSTLPVLGLQPAQASSYLMRDAAHLHQLSTVEVGIQVLGMAGDDEAAKALAGYFALFCQSYLLVRPQLLAKNR